MENHLTPDLTVDQVKSLSHYFMHLQLISFKLIMGSLLILKHFKTCVSLRLVSFVDLFSSISDV